MSDPSTGTATHHDPLELVLDSARAGWGRMVDLLFRGPNASVGGWMRWGLLILLAGASAGGSGNLGGSWPSDNGGGWRSSSGQMFGWSHEEFFLFLAIMVPLAVLAGLCWVYLMCRFRLVLVDAVVSGEPRLRGVYGRTASGGLALFVLELVIGLTCLVLIGVPIALFVVAVVTSQRSVPVMVAGGIALALVVLPLLLICALAAWFSRSLLTPVVWRREGAFTENLSHAWKLVRKNWLAVLLLALAECFASIAAAVVSGVLLCLTCCVWIWPALLAAGMIALTFKFILAGFVLLPVALAVLFLVSWFFAALLAPIAVFFRCWTYAFMARLDPDLGGWAVAPVAPAVGPVTPAVAADPMASSPPSVPPPPPAPSASD